MDTGRQILRFSIPGSIFLLHGVVCYLLFRRIQGVPFVEASTPIKENIAAVIAVLATIPVGFLIYQFYYFTYEPVLRLWPLPWKGRLVRRDRGGQILKRLDEDEIKALEKIFRCTIDRKDPHSVVPSGGSPIQRLMHATGVLEVSGTTGELPVAAKERQLAYEDLWYTHWDALRSAMEVASTYEAGVHIKSEYTALSDIYHSLGAARTAVLSAWIGTCVLSVSHIGRIQDDPEKTLAGIFLISVLTFSIYAVLHVARGRTWRTAAASLTFGLRWLHWRHGQELRDG